MCSRKVVMLMRVRKKVVDQAGCLFGTQSRSTLGWGPCMPDGAWAAHSRVAGCGREVEGRCKDLEGGLLLLQQGRMGRSSATTLLTQSSNEGWTTTHPLLASSAGSVQACVGEATLALARLIIFTQSNGPLFLPSGLLPVASAHGGSQPSIPLHLRARLSPSGPAPQEARPRHLGQQACNRKGRAGRPK